MKGGNGASNTSTLCICSFCQQISLVWIFKYYLNFELVLLCFAFFSVRNVTFNNADDDDDALSVSLNEVKECIVLLLLFWSVMDLIWGILC